MIRKLAAAAALSALVLVPAAQAQTPAPSQAPSQATGAPDTAAPEGPQDATVAVDGGDDMLLFGSFLRPAGGSYPTVLILPAQGADRNGNSSTDGPKPDTYRMLANDLVAKGVASLRIDKRGVGASAKAIGREEDLRFDTYVNDAVTWIKFLKSQPHVNCLAVLGHAEGALVAALAAKQIKVCAVIEVAGAGRPAAAVLAEQLKTASDTGGMDKDNYDEASRILDTLANGKTVAAPPEKLKALFRPSVQPYLISWLDLNPVDALRTAPPTLILQGTADRQLDPADAQKLAAAPKVVRVVMIPGADHDLKIGGPANKAADVAAPVAPMASTAIADFLKRLKWP
jgi:alpha-beta hydrolase superfamily lysophospholipase